MKYYSATKNIYSKGFLTLTGLRISKSCIKIKINLNFYFRTFDEPKRSVKIKISVNFISLIQYEVKTSHRMLPAFTLISYTVSFFHFLFLFEILPSHLWKLLRIHHVSVKVFKLSRIAFTLKTIKSLQLGIKFW